MGRGYWLVKQEPTRYSFDQLRKENAELRARGQERLGA